MTGRYDLVILGGGTAGLVAAIGAAGIGARVALVEADRLGGDCLWTGCVPSKTLLAAAATAHAMRTADRHGLTPHEPVVDLAKVMAVVRQAQAAIAPHDSPERLQAAGVEVVPGYGRFDGPGRIAVGDRLLRYRAALIAVGTRPVLPPIEGLATVNPLTSDDVWLLETLPARLVILGGGPIGCELGQAFARLGSSVTVVEAEANLLPRETPELGRSLAIRLREEGLDVRTGTSAVAAAIDTDGQARLELVDGEGTKSAVPFDRILVAVGRRPSTGGLGLDTVDVELDERGHVTIDATLRTTGDRIWAAGDVTGEPPFTHVAGHHGRLVVTNALLRTRRQVERDIVPRVTFTDPEIARVGLDAVAATARWGARATIVRLDHRDLDRAVAHGDVTGWSELVGDPRGRLVGATVVGPAAGESIAELTAWLAMGRTIADISTTIHAYPTFAEGAARAADELQRSRFLSPGVRRFTRPLLGLLRRFDHPRERRAV